MHSGLPAQDAIDARAIRTRPVAIVALDRPDARAAFDLVERLPDATFFKVGLQLFTAEGPDVVRRLKGDGMRVFLDLKLHDIPNTVAGAVRSATELGADIVSLHAAGGAAMLEAAADAVAGVADPPLLFAVTVLTSLNPTDLSATWGRSSLSLRDEAARLARFAANHGCDGVVASVHEADPIRRATRADFPILAPGIRLPGDQTDDQVRVATPADAARLGIDFIVVGRSVTAGADPAAAYQRIARVLAADEGSENG
ncbi:MAG: orotidine-5'-phosphate decarboxylase [Gemmatimonas sp.]|nr:orotidine-5'-phosphate decarboxylase [Gemmatimonas sp.]